jgi:hypothetical protein
MKIFIPTYKRLHKQKTLDNLHDKSNVWLVVREEEAEEARKLHDQIFVLDPHVSNFPETVENIVMKNAGERIIIADDDLKFVRFREGEPTPLGYAKWTTSTTAEEQAEIWKEVERLMDEGYAHGGWWHAGLAAKKHDLIVEKPYDYNVRYNNVKWYDLTAFDPADINWTDVVAAEDYHVAMQLTLMGFESIIMRHWAFRASPSHTSGGCSEYRTHEVHNQSQLKLAELYPEYITANEPNEKGIVTINIAFKRAAKETKEKMQQTSLESFFE